MNKFLSVLLAIVVVLVVVIFLVFFRNCDGSHPKAIEIITNPGAKVFAKLPEGEEQFINSVPELGQIKVDIPTGADVILRYNNAEETFASQEWQEEDTIVFEFLISIEVNANPWAYVFIKLPDGADFIKPRRQDFVISPDPGELNTNVTPIRGGLQVPIGTTIKLVYEGREKVFSYETWKDNPRVSHNF